MEQFQTDLNSERAALQKMESAKLTLEKQVRKLRPTLNAVPFMRKFNSSAANSALPWDIAVLNYIY